MVDSRPARALRPVSLISHSHTVIGVQPLRCSARMFRPSRLTVPSNLRCQNSELDLGVAANLQPGWRCQKHPCTKIAARYFGSTISGRPGRSFTCSLNRKPLRCKNRRTAISGPVSLPLIAAMFRERAVAEILSITARGLHTPVFYRNSTMPGRVLHAA